MKATFVKVLLGATLLLTPWVISRVAQDGLHIRAFFGLGLPSTAANTAKTATDARMSREKAMQTVKAVPIMASGDSGMLTCDDFGSCPEGWSLVASPSLILCGQQCKKETCCSADQASEVIEVKERKLLVNDNDTTTMTATTTVTSTTTVYSPIVGNNDTNTSTIATTATATATTSTTITGTTTVTSTMTGTTTASSAAPTEEIVVVFEMVITLTDGQLQNFLVSEDIKKSFEESMAERLNIPKSWVHAQLAATRRLAEGSAHLRRLASVTVSYTITIPAPANLPATGLGSAVTLAAVQSGISSTDTAALTTAIDGKLAAKGLASTFSVTVDSIGTITVDVRTFTTTSTMTNPVIEDDSFAFTKVAFTPAHVLTLLAMVLTAMSS
mmetsp:Transcript_42636/g.90801  ORF Transcript_42636/g.90801 Transcript_42636/m.90801 type:complete len:385 (-) Transcript_42636:124-1278(-)